MNQRGFSLVSVMVSSLILTVGFLFISQILLQTQVIGNQQNRYVGFNDLRDQMMSELGDRCSINNTVEDGANNGLKCLLKGTCSEGTTGDLQLRDRSNRVVYSRADMANFYLSGSGGTCSGPNCVHELRLKYTVKCPDGTACSNPYTLIEGSFDKIPAKGSSEEAPQSLTAAGVINYDLYRFEKQIYYKKPYRSCDDALSQGKDTSGLYLVDPDGNGGECPFEVYCDQASDDGGWALVANQSITTEAINEVLPPLHKGMTGRLSQKQIELLLRYSTKKTGNNARVILDSKSTGVYTMAFHVPNGAVGHYSNSPTTCQSVNAAPQATQHSVAPDFQFFARSASAKMGYNGKFFCDACDVAVPVNICGVPNGGCCDSATHGTMEGSLWIR